MKKPVIFLLLICFSAGLFASPQMSDYLITGKDTIVTYNLILEQYLQKQDTVQRDQLFGLTFREGASFNCWRGYQAIYKIADDSLFLLDIINCGELRTGRINKSESAEKMRTIFGDRLVDGRVFINWFSGCISIPRTFDVLRWDGVFYRIFEKEKIFEITEGLVVKVEDVENYKDDPKRINRRYKTKISDILFKQLKKAKWKNTNDFDCSSEYLVTIDHDGNISRVRMCYTDEEIDKYYEIEQYDYCINKMFVALKSLKFDIIKNKGIPISEEIYIEIWIEDNGKIENWTN